MITAILLIYIGIHIAAPWWYFMLAGVVFFAKMIGVIANIILKVGKCIDD